MNIKRTLAGILSVAMAAVTCVTTASVGNYDTNIVTAADDCNDDWLHAVGSRLYDKDGNQVWLTGANWFGLNCTENIPHGLYAADCDDFLSAVADKGINIIRFPISTELLVSWMEGTPNPVGSVNASYTPPKDEVGEDGKVTPAGYFTNINKDFVLEDGKTLKTSLEIFDVIIQKCKKYGIKAFVDVHSPASHNSGHNYNLWYYNENADDCDGMATMADGRKVTWDMWIESVTWLAKRYANDDTILAYDLKNEPHGKRMYDGDKCPDSIAKWDKSTDHNNWKYSAEECGKSILKVNPNALILIEGIEQYPKTEKGYTFDTPDIFNAPADQSPWYGGWWGGNLRGVKDNPVDFGSPSLNSQIVYSPHDYGPSVYAQSWFAKDFDTDSLLKDYWYDTWAYINDKDIAPLLIGEWGGYMDGKENEKWMGLLRDYMIANHINHTFWCLNPNSGDTGGLLGYDFQTWDMEKYGLFEPSLWQTASGKYIGLDHQKALGNNGISVADYYKSGEKSNLDSDGSVKPKDPVEVPTEATTPVTQPTTTATQPTTIATQPVTQPTTSATQPVTQPTTIATQPVTQPTTSATQPVTQPTTSATQPITSATQPANTPTTDGKLQYGDVDLNGTVELADVTKLSKYLLNKNSFPLDNETAEKNADVTHDGTVDSRDISKLLEYNIGKLTKNDL